MTGEHTDVIDKATLHRAIARIVVALDREGLEASPDVCTGLAFLVARMAADHGVTRATVLDLVGKFYDQAKAPPT
jgi:hypothetical protein